MYSPELNPRLQVEHPVTEMITHVNISIKLPWEFHCTIFLISENFTNQNRLELSTFPENNVIDFGAEDSIMRSLHASIETFTDELNVEG